MVFECPFPNPIYRTMWIEIIFEHSIQGLISRGYEFYAHHLPPNIQTNVAKG
jgi:hypothetical protein